MKRLTYDQHVKVGLQLKKARAQLMVSWVEICAGAGKSSRSCTLIQRTAKELESLRCELDGLLFKDYEEKDFNELKSVYYGPLE